MSSTLPFTACGPSSWDLNFVHLGFSCVAYVHAHSLKCANIITSQITVRSPEIQAKSMLGNWSPAHLGSRTAIFELQITSQMSQVTSRALRM